MSKITSYLGIYENLTVRPLVLALLYKLLSRVVTMPIAVEFIDIYICRYN